MKLMDFQSDDINKFWWNQCGGRALFGWKVGTGKTFSGAHIVSVFKGWNMKVLVVTKGDLLVEDWIENCKERGVDLKKSWQKHGETDFTITTYGRTKKITGDYDIVISDECQAVKNQSDQGKAFVKLAQRIKYVLMMSGTLSNFSDPQELLNYLWSLNTPEIKRRLPKNITGYRRDYCFGMKTPNGGYRYVSSKEGSILINSLFEKYVVFRSLDDTDKTIPSFNESIEKVDCRVKLKDIKERYEKELGIEIDDNYENPCVIHQLMMDNGIDYDTGKLINKGKLESTLDFVQGIGKERAIAWVYFKVFGVELQKYLTKNKIKSGLINGDTTKKERLKILKQHKDGDIQIIVASLGTIAEGHNLQYCRYAITCNQWFDVIKDTQARGRIERTGQKFEMYHVRLVAKGGLEEYVMKVLTDKVCKKDANDFLIGVLQKKYGVK